MTLPPGIRRLVIPTTLPVGNVNVYLIEGAVPTLVDCGPWTVEAATALWKGLGEARIDPSAIRQVVLTHPHVDHAGLAAEVARMSGAPVLAHPDAGPTLAAPGAAIRRTVRHLEAWGRRHGVPAPILGRIIRSYTRWSALTEPVEVVTWLEAGDLLVAGDAVWRVLHTPGHSSGHICLFREEDGTLLSGDHLLPGIPSSPLPEPAADGRPRPAPQILYLAHLARLAALDVRHVLPGHGEPFSATREVVATRIAQVHAKANEVCRLLESGPRTAWDLCAAVFPQVGEENLLFALANTAGYLDLLAAQGRVAPLEDRSPVVFSGVPLVDGLLRSRRAS